MTYKICIFLQNTIKGENFGIFFDEIMSMSIDIIQDGIDSCKMVMENIEDTLWWGAEVSEIEIKKDIATLTYHGEFVANIPTIELYKMLQKYIKAMELLEELNKE